MGDIILYILNSEKYFEGVTSIIKNEVGKKNIVYLTTNKPYDFLTNTLKKKNVPADKIFFIDCISKYVGKKITKEPENCVFLESPEDLTTMSISITESVKNLNSPKLLFLDSLSILLIYNDAKTLGKFSNFIMNKMRELDVDTVLLALESDTDKDVIKQIESIADEVKK